jgi:hypothetical protein
MHLIPNHVKRTNATTKHVNYGSTTISHANWEIRTSNHIDCESLTLIMSIPVEDY